MTPYPLGLSAVLLLQRREATPCSHLIMTEQSQIRNCIRRRTKALSLAQKLLKKSHYFTKVLRKGKKKAHEMGTWHSVHLVKFRSSHVNIWAVVSQLPCNRKQEMGSSRAQSMCLTVAVFSMRQISPSKSFFSVDVLKEVRSWLAWKQMAIFGQMNPTHDAFHSWEKKIWKLIKAGSVEISQRVAWELKTKSMQWMWG